EEVSLESLVAEVADDFLERQRQGERPDIEDYAARYPHAAEVLRKVLASLQLVGLSADGGLVTGETVEGELLARTLGDFRIICEVGRGGMGIVYEAEQMSLGRRVALKVLPFAATMDSRHLHRFQNEARAAASLEHPHIVPVYAVGCERGVHYYAMQFIEGRDLASELTNPAPRPGRFQGRRSKACGEARCPVRRASGGACPRRDCSCHAADRRIVQGTLDEVTGLFP